MVESLSDWINSRMPWWVIPCVVITFLTAFAAGVSYGKRGGD